VGTAATAYAMKRGEVLIDFTVVANLYADFAIVRLKIYYSKDAFEYLPREDAAGIQDKNLFQQTKYKLILILSKIVRCIPIVKANKSVVATLRAHGSILITYHYIM